MWEIIEWCELNNEPTQNKHHLYNNLCSPALVRFSKLSQAVTSSNITMLGVMIVIILDFYN